VVACASSHGTTLCVGTTPHAFTTCRMTVNVVSPSLGSDLAMLDPMCRVGVTIRSAESYGIMVTFGKNSIGDDITGINFTTQWHIRDKWFCDDESEIDEISYESIFFLFKPNEIKKGSVFEENLLVVPFPTTVFPFSRIITYF
jgi:hypothetical protein